MGRLLAAMGPLQKAIHLLKLQKAKFIGPYVSTWIAGEAPELAHVMEAMASITVGCVRVERSIKVQKMIHSKVRNRLLHRKVEMLVQIYMNARLCKAPACEVTSLEDMLQPESEEQMEVILGDMVDEAIRAVHSKDAIVVE
jgi:cell division GTPase FtsZ